MPEFIARELKGKIARRPRGELPLRERSAYYVDWNEHNRGDAAAAPETVTGAWNADKVAAFRESFYEFLGYVRINSKEKGGDFCLADGIYEAQHRLLDAVFDGLAEDIHDFKCLKSRQLGVSTISRALMIFWLGMHRGMQGAMIFDTEAHKEEAREEIEQMIASLPVELGFPKIMKLNRYNLLLGNNSRLRFMAAGVKSTKSSGVLGRSSGINLVHACMAPGTPVLVADGRIKAIEDVVVGDSVVTHTGASGRIVANVGRPNDRGPMIRITPWLGSDVLMTGDHKIPTQRGLIEARDVKKTDLLVMPVRRIRCERTLGVLPTTVARPQSGGAIAAASGVEVVFDEEFGFAIGFYLAEGTITYQRRGAAYYDAPSGLVLSRSEAKKAYADRAVAALQPYTTGRRTVKFHQDSLTVSDHLYGSAFARWIEANFGAREQKYIPDEVFNWGENFCRGLLAGLLAGDGSKTHAMAGKYPINRVNLVSTRVSIAMQARDLAASLGFGWASVKYRAGGNRYGRNCQEAWVVDWCGQAAAGLRALIGLPVFRTLSRIDKYRIDNQRVLIKIRKIEPNIDVPMMWDLSVDHVDHTFRTPWMAVSNSEICSWENEEGVVALKNALSRNYPDRLYLWESTARGYNQWHDMWEEAKNDDLNQRTVFIGWWSKEDQRISRSNAAKWERYGAPPPTEREFERLGEVSELYGWDIDPEQLAWYRQLTDPNRDRDEDEPEDSYQLQDQPWTENDAFQMSGSTFFEVGTLKQRAESASRRRYTGYKFAPGTDFVSTEIFPAKVWRDVDVKIWEEPVSDAVYVVSADPAFGHSPTSNHSAVEVGRCFADQIEQVAEFTSTSTLTHQLAYLIWALVGFYGSPANNQVLVIIEINGPGESVWREFGLTRAIVQNGYLRPAARDKGLTDLFYNARNYVYSRSDSMHPGHNYHWKTNHQLKVAIMERLRDFVHNGGLVINSLDALEEMKAISRNGDEIAAEGSSRDDRTVALAMMVRAWEEKLRRGLIGQNRTKEADVARRRMSIVDQFRLFNQYRLSEMFKRKDDIRRIDAMMAQRAALRTRTRMTPRQVRGW